jgi:hypothetical protein
MKAYRRQYLWKLAARCIVGLFCAVGLVGVLSLAGCSGGAGSSGSQSFTSSGAGTGTSATTGGALVTLTDAPGDFLSYLVTVVSLKLTRADGTVVETVPTKTQVDFAQLLNLSEVISAAQIPIGNYVAAALTLDYAGASLVVDNGAGGLTVAASNIINGATNAPLVAPNSQITVSLQLPANGPLVITPGTVANLALDFNLSASETVAPATIMTTTAASAVTVTVNPVLTASLVPDTTKQIRVRGPLVSVTDTSANTSYTVSIQPFFNGLGSPMGQLAVNTTPSTTFAINGTAYAGAAGLTALSALPMGTLTSAIGGFDLSTRTFTATTVTAGTSTIGANLDSVEGTVIARSANTVTLSDGWIYPRDFGGAQFHSRVTVTIAATTAVSEAGVSGTFGLQDISVGQHVQFFGTGGTDSSGNRTLDASQGSAQLSITTVLGQAASSTTGSITVTLQSLDGQAPSVFNFAGTGAGAAQDATAAAYVVSVPSGLLNLPVTAGSPIKLLGFVTPFGAAPPDFAAVSLVSYANTNAQLRLAFNRPGLTAPFVAPLSAAHVLIAQSTLQSAARDVIYLGPARLDPGASITGLSLEPNTAATDTAFAIGHASSYSTDTYATFADLIAALTADLNGTTALLEISAVGPYDSVTEVLSVNKLVVLLNE